MLGNGMERLYKVQPYHFPGIVADISLESLSSPSAEDNLRYNNTQNQQAVTTLSPLINTHSDINQNISCDKTIHSLAKSCDNNITSTSIDVVEANANHSHSDYGQNNSSSVCFSENDKHFDVGKNIRNSGTKTALHTSYTNGGYYDMNEGNKLDSAGKKGVGINCNSWHGDNFNSNGKYENQEFIISQVTYSEKNYPNVQLEKKNDPITDSSHKLKESSEKINGKISNSSELKVSISEDNKGRLVHTLSECSDTSSSVTSIDSESAVKFPSISDTMGNKLVDIQENSSKQSLNFVDTNVSIIPTVKPKRAEPKSFTMSKTSHYEPESFPVSNTREDEQEIFQENNCYPIVNIRTLGDGTDGSYEINIQNLYPTSLPSDYLEDDLEEEIEYECQHDTVNTVETQCRQIETNNMVTSNSNGNFSPRQNKEFPNYTDSVNRNSSFKSVKQCDRECYGDTSNEEGNNKQTLESRIDYFTATSSACVAATKQDQQEVTVAAESSRDFKCNEQYNHHKNSSFDEESCYVKHNNHSFDEDSYLKHKNNAFDKEEDCNIKHRNNSFEFCNNVKHRNKSFEKEYCNAMHKNESFVEEDCNVKVGKTSVNILLRSQSDESHKKIQPPEELNKEERINKSYSVPSEVHEIHKRRKRRPRKLPEIPKQQYQQRKDLHLNLPLNLSCSNIATLSTEVKPKESLVLSLADELQQAMCSGGEGNQTEDSNSSNSTSHEASSSKHMIQYSSNENGLEKDQFELIPSLMGVKSIIALEDLGSPEHVEPPSFRDSGFFGDFDYNAEILKQEVQLRQQQQVLLRQLYKDRNRKSYASDCDSGYTTQDPECQSRPSSTGPVLCYRCGSSASQTEENDTNQFHFQQQQKQQQQSPQDYYIDDDVQHSGNVGFKKKDIVLEYNKNGNSELKQKIVEQSIPDEKDEGIAYKKRNEATKTSAEDTTPPTFYLGESEDHLMVTHRCCHKFVPRHSDELFIEIGDPIFVEKEDDDLWCNGTNLRTKKKGIFPSVCATDLNFLEGEGDGTYRPVRFYLRLLGSVQVKYYKGTQVLTQAIQKVVMSRRMTMTSNPPNMCCLEITDYGIRLSDKKSRRISSSSKMPRSLSQIFGKKDAEKEVPTSHEFNHFYSLKNVTFCGYHPTNQKYFAFITKHPLEMKFACHVLLAEESTACISEAIGASFKRYYQQYLAATHPTEDIYLEN